MAWTPGRSEGLTLEDREARSVAAKASWSRRKAAIDLSARLYFEGWPPEKIAERVGLSLKALDKLTKDPHFVKVYDRLTDKMESRMVDRLSEFDLQSEGVLAAERIVKRASGVAQHVMVEEIEGVRKIIEKPASIETRQRDDHFLAELVFPKKRDVRADEPGDSRVGDETVRILKAVAETLKQIGAMQGHGTIPLSAGPAAGERLALPASALD